MPGPVNGKNFDAKSAAESDSCLKKILHWVLWILVIFYFVMGALILSARYLLIPYVNDHKTDIESLISQKIGLPVKVESFHASWSTIYPLFRAENITVGEAPNALTIKNIDATLSYLSVFKLKPIFAEVILNEPTLKVIRDGNDKFSVLGFDLNADKAESSQPLSPADDEAIELLLDQRKITVRHLALTLQDEANGRELKVPNINIGFRSTPLAKRLGFQIALPAELSAPLDVRMAFKPPIIGKLTDWDSWTGEIYAQSDYLNFDELAGWLPDFNVTYRGIASGSVWLSLDHWKPTAGTFIGALSSVELQLAPELKPLKIKELTGRISLSDADNKIIAKTDDFYFELANGQKSPSLDLAFELDKNKDGTISGGSVKANFIDIKRFAGLTPSLPMPVKLREFIDNRALSGQLYDVDFYWVGPIENPVDFNGEIKFRNLTSEGSRKKDAQWLPGIKNLTGFATASAKRGSITLDTKDAQVAFPGIFPVAAFELNVLNGKIDWDISNRLKLTFTDVNVENKDVAVSVAGSYELNDSPLGFIDLAMHLQRGEASSAWKYIPLICGEDSIRWLRYGLVAGKATGGEAKLSGPLDKFPFKDGTEGEFSIDLPVSGVTLDVYPNKMDNPNSASVHGKIWPMFNDVAGQVGFHRDSMTIVANEGTYKNAHVIKAQVEIPGFSDDTVWLNVNASAKGDLPSFLSYSASSPINGYSADIFTKAEGKGEGQLRLALAIPLSGPGDVKVNGEFDLLGDEVNFHQYSIPELKNAKGTVAFSEKGVSAKSLTATSWGEPVKGSISTSADGSIHVHASGTFPAEGLHQVIPVELLANASQHYLTGKSPFDLNVGIEKDIIKVSVKSSLEGMASKLPAPLTKAASSKHPLDLELKVDKDLVDLSLFINGLFNGEIFLKDGSIVKAAIGNQSLPSLPSRGYAISITGNELSVPEWTKVIETSSKKADGKHEHSKGPTQLPEIAFVQINLKKLLIENFNQDNFSLFCHSTENGLKADIKSDELTANMEWIRGQNGKQPELFAHFSKLFIPSAAGEVAAESKPVEVKGGWPAISAVVDDLTYGRMRLGKVELKARNTIAANGHLWQIQKLAVTNPDASLLSSGSWLKSLDGNNRTTLLIDNQINNLGSLLGRLDHAKLVRGGSGQIKGELSWDGTPLGFNTESFDGKLDINLKRGEILKIEPGAGAKLLSLLSLQSLTRYLTLDFRDFYSKGFNFSTIRGDTSINDGLMNIKDLTMVGSGATVVMNGDVNMRKETEKLRILVLPDINAAGASIALAIANPIAGIGSFLAQLIFKDPLSKLFSFEYEVTGTWNDPVVKKVDTHHF